MFKKSLLLLITVGLSFGLVAQKRVKEAKQPHGCGLWRIRAQ